MGDAMAIRRYFVRLLSDTEAATAVEYAVMLALILATVITSITLVGTRTNTLWTNINNSVTTVSS
jgi:Flp pilus assembly pilin Flp